MWSGLGFAFLGFGLPTPPVIIGLAIFAVVFVVVVAVLIFRGERKKFAAPSTEKNGRQ